MTSALLLAAAVLGGSDEPLAVAAAELPLVDPQVRRAGFEPPVTVALPARAGYYAVRVFEDGSSFVAPMPLPEAAEPRELGLGEAGTDADPELARLQADFRAAVARGDADAANLAVRRLLAEPAGDDLRWADLRRPTAATVHRVGYRPATRADWQRECAVPIDCHFHDAPLADVLGYFSRRTGRPIRLSAPGRLAQVRVFVRSDGQPAGRVLEAALDSVGLQLAWNDGPLVVAKP